MNKVPRILDDAGREEAIIAALARRRRLDVQPVLDVANHIDQLKTTIRQIDPDIDLPAYNIAEIEWALPDAYAAKLAEGQELVASLQATLDRLQEGAATARRASMSPIERQLLAQNDELRRRIETLEAAAKITRAIPDDRPDARVARQRASAPQMCMPTTGAVRPTSGWFGAPTGVMEGSVQLLRRSDNQTPARPAMLSPGSPHRKALPGTLG